MTGSGKIVAYDLMTLLADYPGMTKRSAASPQAPRNSEAPEGPFIWPIFIWASCFLAESGQQWI